MPTYLYRCVFKHTHERVRPIADRHNLAACPECLQNAHSVPVPFALAPENTTPTGKRVWEAGMDKDAKRITEYRQESEIQGIHDCVVESNQEVNDLGRIGI